MNAAVYRATTDEAIGWEGMTLAELRALVAHCDRDGVPDGACLVAVTKHGTSELRGVGFFSMGDAAAA